MQQFFNPRSVAVVGASRKNLGNFVVKNLVSGFKGGIYPVNSNYETIEGLPCFASVTDIDAPVDLAIVLVPAQAVPEVLQACAAKGIPRVIIESAGFAESGAAGLALQQRCMAIAAQAGMRLWGPNCMGLVDIPNDHFFTFLHPSVRSEGLLPGRISLIVQSGMMSAIFLAELGRRGIGVSKACSIGNRVDVDECDLLEYLEQDPATDVIALYLESIPRGRRFAELARRSQKPIVLLNGGQSKAGAIAAMSHTHSLSGNARLLGSVLAGTGVVMAEGIFQMMDMAHTLALVPRIDPACRTAIITLSGGAGILMCDALERCGIAIAELTEATKQAVGKVFPPWMPVANPIDLFPAVAHSGRRVAFDCAFEAALGDPRVDTLVIHFVAGLEQDMPDFEALQEKATQRAKVVLFWLMGRREGSLEFREKARAAGIAVHDDATRIAECLRAVAHHQAHKRSGSPEEAARAPSPEATVAAATDPLPSQAATWDEYDSKQLLSQWNIPVTAEQLVHSDEEAWARALQIGFPVVLKGLVPGQAHKTEHGLVKLGIADQEGLTRARADLNNKLKGTGRILLQKQIAGEYELIAGFVRDEHFGACVMFGLGGVLAELEPDVVFALAPLRIVEAVKLIRSIRNRRLLEGFRGMARLDETAMAHLLVQLSRLGAADPRIAQIDINPIVVGGGKPVAVDATVILQPRIDPA
jgi:acyl-CoA synthetase (NDP forming)